MSVPALYNQTSFTRDIAAPLFEAALSLGHTPIDGHTLILAWYSDNAVSVVSVVQAGVAWSKISYAGNGPVSIEVWVGTVGASASGDLVLTHDAAGDIGVVISTYSGLRVETESVVVNSGTGTSLSTGALTANKVYTQQFGFFVIQQLGGATLASTWDDIAPVSSEPSPSGARGLQAGYVGNNDKTGAETLNIKATASISTGWAALGVTFKPAITEPEVDIAKQIAAAGLGLTRGTSLYNGHIRPPIAGVPLRSVFCFTLPGSNAENYLFGGKASPQLSTCTVRVVVRGDAQKHSDALGLARRIRDAIHMVLPATGYVSSRVRQSEPDYIGEDDDAGYLYGLDVDLQYTE